MYNSKLKKRVEQRKIPPHPITTFFLNNTILDNDESKEEKVL